MENIDKAIGKLTEALERHGPEAVDFALGAARFNAAKGIAYGLIFLGIFIAAFRHFRSWLRSDDTSDSSEIVAFGCVAVMCFTFLAVCITLLNFNNWIGLYDPRMYLAIKALNL